MLRLALLLGAVSAVALLHRSRTSTTSSGGEPHSHPWSSAGREEQTLEERLHEQYSRSIGEECDWCKDSLRGRRSQKCSGCEATFCSLKCKQKAADWHVICSPHPLRPVTTADTLYCAVHRHSLPEDAQTLEDYGFNKVWTRTARIYLVCVYLTAMHDFRKSPTEMHLWRMSGTLQKHLQSDIADELSTVVQNESEVWYWFFRNVDVFRPPVSSVFPKMSTARRRYSNWATMPPRILDSIACMRDAVNRNIIPKNPNTLADYRFTRIDARNHGMLLAVYAVLFRDKDVYPSDILLLRDGGILKDNIVAKMHSPIPITPPHVLEWFDNNRDIFEDDKPVSLWEITSGSGAEEEQF